MESTTTSSTTCSNKQPESTSTFTSMSIDIHISVLHHLDPSDIMSFRKTCKTFLDVTNQRIVWINALKIMCLKNTVYSHSYPVKDMSVPELEHAASIPERWNRYIRKHDEQRDFMPPSITRTLPFPNHLLQPTSFSDSLRLLEQLHLVPGGRFLVTLLKGRIQVWDLGITGSAKLNQEPIAESPSKGHWFSIHQSSDGESLRIITSYRHTREESWHRRGFEVFEIFPWKPDAKLKVIATLSVESPLALDFTSVVGDILICVFSSVIKIWNFVTHGWTTWNTGKPTEQILATDKCIILIEPGNLSVWDIPALSYGIIGEYPTIEPDTVTQPRARIAYPTDRQPPALGGGICHGLDDWYTGSSQPHWFDVVVGAGAGASHPFSHSFHRFKINIDAVDLPVVTSVCSFNVSRHPVTSFSPYRVCGDDISILTWNSNRVAIHTGSSSPGDNNHSFVLSRQPTWTPHQMSFCPISGRLCYITLMGVKVLDYFSFPSLQDDTRND